MPSDTEIAVKYEKALREVKLAAMEFTEAFTCPASSRAIVGAPENMRQIKAFERMYKAGEELRRFHA